MKYRKRYSSHKNHVYYNYTVADWARDLAEMNRRWTWEENQLEVDEFRAMVELEHPTPEDRGPHERV